MVLFSRILPLLLVAALLPGCSLRKLTVGQVASVLSVGARTFDTETDPDLAREAIPGTLKLLEGFLEADPEEPELLRLLARYHMGFALGYVEDEAEVLDDDDPDQAAHLRGRAYGLYMRASGFGLRLLALQHPELAAQLERGDPPARDLLEEVDEDSLAGLFWTAAPWAAAINTRRSDVALVSLLPIVKLLLERCLEIDEGFFWAGAHFGLGGIAAAIPKALGGSSAQARKHFDRAIELGGGKHLMTRVLYARMVGQQEGDRAFFESALKEVLATSVDVEESLNLPNRLAHRRAKRYLSQIDDLFL